jgi:hypothetical protein
MLSQPILIGVVVIIIGKDDLVLVILNDNQGNGFSKFTTTELKAFLLEFFVDSTVKVYIPDSGIGKRSCFP